MMLGDDDIQNKSLSVCLLPSLSPPRTGIECRVYVCAKIILILGGRCWNYDLVSAVFSDCNGQNLPLGDGKAKTIKNSIYFASNPIMLRYRLRFILRSHLASHRLHVFRCFGHRLLAATIVTATMSKCNSNAHNWKINHEQISFACDAVVCARVQCACASVQKHQSHIRCAHCCSCYAIFPI